MESTVEVYPAVTPSADPALVTKLWMEKYVQQVEKWIKRDLGPLVKGELGTEHGSGVSTYADGSEHKFLRTTLFVQTADCCHHIAVYRYYDGSSDMHLLTRIEEIDQDWEQSFDRISAGAWRNMLWLILEYESGAAMQTAIAKSRMLREYKEKLKAKKRLAA